MQDKYISDMFFFVLDLSQGKATKESKKKKNIYTYISTDPTNQIAVFLN